jgi:DNA-binding SARP family transcriptional activator
LANGLTSAGDYASAIQAALAAIRLEPLRESSHRCLIRTHLAEGNRSEAIRAYREYADRLERELGIDPSPLLRELPGMGHFHV